jgi:hypothetical protein
MKTIPNKSQFVWQEDVSQFSLLEETIFSRLASVFTDQTGH